VHPGRCAAPTGAVFSDKAAAWAMGSEGSMIASCRIPSGPTARVGRKFVRFPTGFKISFWSHAPLNERTKSRSAVALEPACGAESPEDPGKSGCRPQLDCAQARARSQIDDKKLTFTFRQYQFQDEAVRPSCHRSNSRVSRYVDRGRGERARDIAAAWEPAGDNRNQEQEAAN
jgi:hypothetical protein